jgi:hypothetical protein
VSKLIDAATADLPPAQDTPDEAESP